MNEARILAKITGTIEALEHIATGDRRQAFKSTEYGRANLLGRAEAYEIVAQTLREILTDENQDI